MRSKKKKSQKQKNNKLLLVSHCGWGVYNFRNHLIKKAHRNGYEVVVVSPFDEYIDNIESQGFRWIEWEMNRGSVNPLNELKSLVHLAKIYIEEDPDVIHQDTMKPSLYGSLSVLFNRYIKWSRNKPKVISSFMGLGFLFSDHRLAYILRCLLLPVFRLAFGSGSDIVTFSNKVDMKSFLDIGIISEKDAKILVSEFVDTEKFTPPDDHLSNLGGEVVVLMASRLIWDKGVWEFVDASKTIKNKELSVQFWLAGDPDTKRPDCVPKEKLTEWEEQGLIKWLGHRSDMPEVLRKADIAVLPTYYNEGLPRFLVEAASTGLPLIATDIEACRRVVDHEENGLLIREKNVEDLKSSILEIAKNNEKRKKMGLKSRKIAVDKLSKQENIEKWLSLYRKK